MLAAYQPAVVAPASDQSDVIEIVGTRSDQALKIDRRSYRVQQNPHTQQKDSIQLLRGIPAVTVTPDDQINLLGTGNVTIQVDGRTVSDPDTIAYLRTLHGSDIDRIEVITNPSAQYSASGTGGIINFVLRKKRSEGVSGNAAAEFSRFGHSSADATVKDKEGKWTYEFSARGETGRRGRSHYSKLRSVEQAPGGPATVNSEEGGGPTYWSAGFASAKVTYDFDPRTSLSAKLVGGVGHNRSTNDVKFTGLTPDFQSFSERQRFTTSASFLSTELNFDHKGKKDGEMLTAGVRVFGNPTDREGNRGQFSDGGTLSTDKLKRFLWAEGQIDWQHPMGKGQILSLGGLWHDARINERYSFSSTAAGASLGPPVIDQFRGIEDTVAAYATFQQPVSTWTLMPGARIERNSRHVTSPGEPEVNVGRTYVFPTLHIEHRLSKTLDLTLSYAKRIQRPNLNDLRPYPLVQDIVTVKQASPYLKDQFTDSYEMNLQYQRKKLAAGVIVYDRETSHLISQSYSAVNGINLVTILNAGHSRDRGAEFDLSTPVIARVKVTASVNLFDSRMPADTPAGRTTDHMFRCTSNGTIEWDGPDRGKKPGDVAQLQWIYASPWRDFQLHQLAWNQLQAAYTHSFSRKVSLTGTLTYNAADRHRLEAPLVQEFYRTVSPIEFKLKLVKTFGKNP